MQNLTVTDVRFHKGDAAFLIDDGNTAILYDTGFGFTGYDVAENVRKLLKDRPLDYIFLTHSHYDHAMGAPYISRRYPEAKIVAGTYAASVFTREGAKRTMRKLDGEVAIRCGITEYEFLGDELRVDITVEDGDVIRAGDLTFEAIFLPGHTKCSIAYYCRERKLLLSVETLGVYLGEGKIMPCYLVSYLDALRSMDRVQTMDIQHIVTPHYGLLSEAETAFFLRNMRKAAEDSARFYMEHLRSGDSPETIIEIFKREHWNGYLREIYPKDALELNTSIMIECIKRELMQ